ncbi:MAG: hypothetical protein E6J53_04850 [Chloroflexi bacterium]|nr:MAG: hypothetical protein E6J53_04850 [Chloroflexota bacterium]
MLLLQVDKQPAVGDRDLLRSDHAVHQLVEVAGRQDELDIVDRTVGIGIAKPLIQELVPDADVRLHPDDRGLPEANLAVEIVDRQLGLSD